MKKEKILKFVGIVKARFAGSDISNISVLIAFYFLLSLFPFVIAIGNILPFLNIDPVGVVEYIDAIVPPDLQSILDPIITSLLTSRNGGLLSISLIGALWSSSRGVNYLQKGFNKAYGITQTTSFITTRLVSLVLVLLAILLMAGFVVVFAFGELVMEWVAPIWPWAENMARAIGDLKWPVAIVFLFCALILAYRVAPDVKVRIRDVLPGAALATGGALALVQLFSIYLRFTARTFSTYGTLGAFFALMFWLQFTAMIVIAGAVLNASIGEYRFGAAQEEESNVDKYLKKTRNSLMQRLKNAMEKRREKKKQKKEINKEKPEEKNEE